jgi:cell division protein FtsZ
MAIMTGVQSAQVLGPSTQKQADRSRASINGSEPADPTGGSADAASWESDGGTEPTEQHNGLDVIR